MGSKNAVIIGCGNIGPVHAAAIAESENANLYGVCDVIEERAVRLAKQYDCLSFTDMQTVLSDEKVDSVHICLPHYLHAEAAILAAKAGKHVVLEKPVALSVAEARGIRRAVEESGIRCCVILQNRLNPSVAAAKEWITGGSLGRMLGLKAFLTWKRTAEYYQAADWRGRKETEGGGLLINQAVHLLDMLYFLGGEIEAVKGNIDTRVLHNVIEVEDTADATLFYKDGKTGLFYASNCYSGDSPFFIELHFEQGVLRYMDDRLTLRKGGEEKTLAGDKAASIGKAYWGSSHGRLIAGFYESFETGEKTYTDLSDAAYSMGLLDAIYASSASRRKEPVELY